MSDISVVGDCVPALEPWVSELTDDITSRALGVGFQAYAAVAEEVLVDVAVGRDGLGHILDPSRVTALHCAGKPLTSLIAHRLQQDGLFSLSAPLGQYLPQLASNELRSLTCDDLLTHCAGLYEYIALIFEATPEDEHDAVMLGAEPDVSAIGLPRYSEFGAWHLLAMALRAASGTGIRQLVETYATQPLGISSDLCIGVQPGRFGEIRDRLSPNCVILRDRTTPQLLNCTERLVSSERAGTGTYGNARALGLLYTHLGSVFSGSAVGGIVDRSTLDTMISERTPTQWDFVMRRTCAYGKGFMVNLSDHLFGSSLGPDSFGHAGYRGLTYAFHDPNSRLTVAVQHFGITENMLAYSRRERAVESLARHLSSG